MILLTGSHPDRESSRDRDRVDFNFRDAPQVADLRAYVTEDAFVQPIRRIRGQPKFPCCVGQTLGAIVDALGDQAELPAPVMSSGVSIWREARRRQGLIEVIEIGTRLEYAIEGLIERGWDPYREGEDLDDEEAGKGAAPAGDDLFDEMFADDKRLAKDIKRYRILGFGSGVLDAVDEALRRGYGVGQGTGLKEPFFSFRGAADKPDVVLGLEHMSGTANGHATRVAGRCVVGGRRRYLIQNSHSIAWGGCHAPDGGWLPGCAWADESVIVSAHDTHALEVRAQ